MVALNKQFPAQTAALAKLYDPSILALAKLNGNLYGIPFINAGISFVWNKKLFAQAGLNPNKPPKTWAQLAVYAKKLTDPSTGVYGYAMLDDSTGEMLSFYPPFLVDYTPGGKFMPTCKWVLNSPQAAKGLGVLVSMYQNGFMPKFGTFAGHDLDTAFLQGKIAMYLNYSDFFPPEAKIKKQYPNLSYGISSPPCGPANCLNFGDIGFWSIATKSKDITEAFNLAEALNTPAVNNGYAHLSGLFPARKGLNPFAGDPTQQAYQKTQTNYMLLPRLPFDYWSILSPQIELALTGTESPAQALNAAASQINNQLQLQPCLGTCVG